MKQWMKYTAVVCSFFMMVVLFFPYSGSDRVIASEGGTVSGGNVAVASEDGEDETGTVPEENTTTDPVEWYITVQYYIDEETPWMDENGNPIVQTSNSMTGSNYTFTIMNMTESPQKFGYEVTGWKLIADSIGERTYGLTAAVEIDGNNAPITVNLIAQWQEVNQPQITESGTYTLNAGKSYTLENGIWTVNDDNSSYSGGIQFYVPSNDSYTFILNN